MPEGFGILLTLIWAEIEACVGTIVKTPILMIPIVLSFVGSIIGLSQGFLGTRRRRRK